MKRFEKKLCKYALKENLSWFKFKPQRSEKHFAWNKFTLVEFLKRKVFRILFPFPILRTNRWQHKAFLIYSAKLQELIFSLDPHPPYLTFVMAHKKKISVRWRDFIIQIHCKNSTFGGESAQFGEEIENWVKVLPVEKNDNYVTPKGSTHKKLQDY